MLFALPANAQKEKSGQEDSIRMYELQEIEVSATRATKKTPIAFTDLSKQTILKNNYGRDIPSLLQLTPSVIATSESGTGVGATSFRMRGSDATRLNVTANGVPLNNPDSHEMYWYDTPDFISSVGSVQIQRGAGTSTNGTGAFGGSVNMTTAPLGTEFNGEASLSYGSYNTNKQAVQIGSGLMGGHWVVDGRLTHISSDGYIDRATSNFSSYMLQAAYYDDNTIVKFISFGGKSKNYLTYNGITKEDMAKYGRRYNTSGQYVTSDGPFVLTDSKGKPYHVNYHDDETDNYLQINNQFIVSHRFNDKWSMNVTGHYTYGYGYYKQYKDDAKMLEYGIEPFYDEAGQKIRKDLIREKLMRNHFGGLIASGNYTSGKIALTFGGSWNIYKCPHWGELDWVQDSPKNFVPGMRWYENDVKKQDANLFAKINWTVAKGLNIYADMQYRHVGYKVWGVNDNYSSATKAMQAIDVDKKFDFFNPKAGVSYAFAKHHNVYASFAIAQKEPTRGDYTDRFTEAFPTAEKMFDYEFGYQFQNRFLTAGVNFYYMKYKDQLVKTGQINDTDDALNINVPDSYRRGIELMASAKITKWFTLSANATFSQNRIIDYEDQIVNYDKWDNGYVYEKRHMDKTTISYSPSVITGVLFDFHIKGFDALLHTQYVSKQYFTNNENPNMVLDAYCVSNLNLGYTLHTRRISSVRFGIAVYNLFNTEYCNNGYGYSFISDGKQEDAALYFPQAPLNVLANITVNF